MSPKKTRAQARKHMKQRSKDLSDADVNLASRSASPSGKNKRTVLGEVTENINEDLIRQAPAEDEIQYDKSITVVTEVTILTDATTFAENNDRIVVRAAPEKGAVSASSRANSPTLHSTTVHLIGHSSTFTDLALPDLAPGTASSPDIQGVKDNAERALQRNLLVIDHILVHEDRHESHEQDLDGANDLMTSAEQGIENAQIDGCSDRSPPGDIDHLEAGQKLEAIFEPPPTDETGLVESSLAEILARAPMPLSPRPMLTTDAHEASLNRSQSEACEHTTIPISAIVTSTHAILQRDDALQPAQSHKSASESTRPQPLFQHSNRASLSHESPLRLSKPSTSVHGSREPASRAYIVSNASRLDTDTGVQQKQKSAIAALHTPPKPVKSSRALTRPNFQLPSDAITARLKTQREERLKKEAEEARKRTEFKARPVPKSATPVEVKLTALSRQRLSLQPTTSAFVEQMDRRASIAQTKRSSTATVRNSNLTTDRRATSAPNRTIRDHPSAARPSLAKTNIASGQADATDEERGVTTIIHDNEKSTLAPPPAGTRITSTSSAPSSDSNSKGSDRITSINKGKEVFNRDKVERAQQARIVHDKADAVKKARDEAAARSKMWAQRQKAKKNTVVGSAGADDVDVQAKAEVGVEG